MNLIIPVQSQHFGLSWRKNKQTFQEVESLLSLFQSLSVPTDCGAKEVFTTSLWHLVGNSQVQPMGQVWQMD